MTYTLVADGGSDKVLLPILNWSLRQVQEHLNFTVVGQWADFSRIPHNLKGPKRYQTAFDLYPCDVLFVHRDAEGQPPQLRREEIRLALADLSLPHIPLVPVRMTEAWLLADEMAIRQAAGNPRGTQELGLPDIGKLEELPDPKGVLHAAIEKASGLNRRRRSRLPVHERVHRIPNYIDDYSCLNRLRAFDLLQQEISELIPSIVAGTNPPGPPARL